MHFTKDLSFPHKFLPSLEQYQLNFIYSKLHLKKKKPLIIFITILKLMFSVQKKVEKILHQNNCFFFFFLYGQLQLISAGDPLINYDVVQQKCNNANHIGGLKFPGK